MPKQIQNQTLAATLWDWSPLNDYFGGTHPGDLDGVISTRDDRILFLEGKQHGAELGNGQIALFKRLSKVGDVLVIWSHERGNTWRTSALSLFRGGKWIQPRPADANDLQRFCRRWWRAK